MTEISTGELYGFYWDTICKCRTALLQSSDDDIAYYLFEEFDVGAQSFLHKETLERLRVAGLINLEVAEASSNLRSLWHKLQQTECTVAQIRTSAEWSELFHLCDTIADKLSVHSKPPPNHT